MFVNRVCLTLVLLQILINYHYFPIFPQPKLWDTIFQTHPNRQVALAAPGCPGNHGDPMNSELLGLLELVTESSHCGHGNAILSISSLRKGTFNSLITT